MPKFLQFKLANKNLQLTLAYNASEKRLLKEEINIKKNKTKQYLLELNNKKNCKVNQKKLPNQKNLTIQYQNNTKLVILN